MVNRLVKILIQAIPIILMIILIPIIENDYLLASIYLIIIGGALSIKYEKRDYIFLIFGFCVISISEYLFIQTGVESFNRKSLLGVMPIWLPLLWAYAFIAIKRGIDIIR